MKIVQWTLAVIGAIALLAVIGGFLRHGPVSTSSRRGAGVRIAAIARILTLARDSSTARVKETVEVSIIDQRKFRFMVDEIPNFALYIMGAMARRIRGMSQAM